jgi:hypothetical protein
MTAKIPDWSGLKVIVDNSRAGSRRTGGSARDWYSSPSWARRWRRWRDAILDYHCPTCHRLAGQPCTDNCPLCNQAHHDDDGDRTDEQHAADIAATTLTRLSTIYEELGHLSVQLDDLSDWTSDAQDDEPAAALLHDMSASLNLTCFLLHQVVSDCVRDIATKLPVRGIDYGTE